MLYVDGYVLAVPNANKAAYEKLAREASQMFKRLGALALVECWGDDVPDGVVTSFPMAVKKGPDETVVFSWTVWPSKAVRDAGWNAMRDDPAMDPDKMPMPFDGKRMIYGGFTPIVGAPLPTATAIQPYLFFRGRCEEAIEYYKATLGAEVLGMMRFKDNPDKPGPDCMPPGLDDKIMHASLRIMGSDIMMSDGMKSGPTDFDCMSLSLTVPNAAEADRVFDALAKEGTVQMPISKTFFSPRFGAVADKFGVSWMVIVLPEG